jgi:hypothetical protein
MLKLLSLSDSLSIRGQESCAVFLELIPQQCRFSWSDVMFSTVRRSLVTLLDVFDDARIATGRMAD